jgi:hypothetical protein
MKREGSGSRSIPLTNGSGRPKNMSDPQHCTEVYYVNWDQTLACGRGILHLVAECGEVLLPYYLCGIKCTFIYFILLLPGG